MNYLILFLIFPSSVVPRASLYSSTPCVLCPRCDFLYFSPVPIPWFSPPAFHPSLHWASLLSPFPFSYRAFPPAPPFLLNILATSFFLFLLLISLFFINSSAFFPPFLPPYLLSFHPLFSPHSLLFIRLPLIHVSLLSLTFPTLCPSSPAAASLRLPCFPPTLILWRFNYLVNVASVVK